MLRSIQFFGMALSLRRKVPGTGVSLKRNPKEGHFRGYVSDTPRRVDTRLCRGLELWQRFGDLALSGAGLAVSITWVLRKRIRSSKRRCLLGVPVNISKQRTPKWVCVNHHMISHGQWVCLFYRLGIDLCGPPVLLLRLTTCKGPLKK